MMRHSATPTPPSSPLGRIGRHVGLGLAVTLVLVLAKLGFEHSEIGRDVERVGTLWLHRTIRKGHDSQGCKAVVVNIGRISQVEIPGSDRKATPAGELSRLLEEIVKC